MTNQTPNVLRTGVFHFLVLSSAPGCTGRLVLTVWGVLTVCVAPSGSGCFLGGAGFVCPKSGSDCFFALAGVCWSNTWFWPVCFGFDRLCLITQEWFWQWFWFWAFLFLSGFGPGAVFLTRPRDFCVFLEFMHVFGMLFYVFDHRRGGVIIKCGNSYEALLGGLFRFFSACATKSPQNCDKNRPPWSKARATPRPTTRKGCRLRCCFHSETLHRLGTRLAKHATVMRPGPLRVADDNTPTRPI